MRSLPAVFAVGGVIDTGLLLIKLIERCIKLVRSLARLWADRPVRGMLRHWK